MMEPLHIRWHLARPLIVPEYPIHLDGLLAWARVEEDRERGIAGFAGQEDLPLARFETGSGWVWQASWLTICPAGEVRQVPMVRRADEAAFAQDLAAGIWSARRKISSINLGSGRYKAYAFNVPTQWADHVDAFCVGDAERVKALVARITALGKLSRNGWGRVAKVEVQTGAEPMAWLRRTMPADCDLGPGWTQSVGRLRPPYWSGNQEMVQEPCS